MISKKDILKMTRVITRQSRGYKARKIVHPNREWTVGLLLFMLVAVVGGVLNARTHVYFNNLDEREVQTSMNHVEYNANRADTAFTIFRERQLTFNALTQKKLLPSSPVIKTEEGVETEVELATSTQPTQVEDGASEEPSLTF